MQTSLRITFDEVRIVFLCFLWHLGIWLLCDQERWDILIVGLAEQRCPTRWAATLHDLGLAFLWSKGGDGPGDDGVVDSDCVSTPLDPTLRLVHKVFARRNDCPFVK